MKVFNSTAKNMLTGVLAAAALAGGYVAGSQTRKTYEENKELHTELLGKNTKIDSLQNDIVELKRQKAGLEFKNELDSINKYGSKNLGTDFYERIINNAALLDNHKNPYNHMKQVMYKIPNEEFWNIHDVSQERWDASNNTREFFEHNPSELEN